MTTVVELVPNVTYIDLDEIRLVGLMRDKTKERGETVVHIVFKDESEMYIVGEGADALLKAMKSISLDYGVG